MSTTGDYVLDDLASAADAMRTNTRILELEQRVAALEQHLIDLANGLKSFTTNCISPLVDRLEVVEAAVAVISQDVYNDVNPNA